MWKAEPYSTENALVKGDEEKEGLTSFLTLNPLSLWMQIRDSSGLETSTVTYLSGPHFISGLSTQPSLITASVK